MRFINRSQDGPILRTVSGLLMTQGAPAIPPLLPTRELKFRPELKPFEMLDRTGAPYPLICLVAGSLLFLASALIGICLKRAQDPPAPSETALPVILPLLLRSAEREQSGVS